MLSLSAAVLLLLITSAPVLAADGGTEISNGEAKNTTHAAGFKETGTSAVAITSDSTGGALTFGADGTDALTVKVDGDNADVAWTVTTTGSANGVIFAGSLVTKAPADGTESITVLTTNDHLTFQGSTIEVAATAFVAINAGSGAANPTINLTFDTAFAETNAHAAKINPVDAGDVVNMIIANSNGTNSNAMGFTDTIGNVAAIDTLVINADTTATFGAALVADLITVNSENTTSFNGAVTGAINIATTATPTISFGTGVGVSAAIDNTSGTAGVGTLTIVDSSNADKVFGGAIGATNKLLAINATTDGAGASALTFSSTVNVATITLIGAGAADETIFNGDVTGNVVIQADGKLTFGADDVMTGNITTTADGKGTLVFGTPTASKTLVTGSIGTNASLDVESITVVTANTLTTTLASGDIFGLAVAVSGAGTMALGNWTGTAITVGSGTTVSVAADKVLTGNVLEASDGVGTLTFAATTTSMTILTGTVGSDGGSDDMLALNVAPATGVTATVASTVNATTTTNSGAGTLAIGGAADTNIVLSGAGGVSLAGHLVGTITNTGTANTGVVSIADGVNATGQIGTSAKPMLSLTMAGDTTLTAAVHAVTISGGEDSKTLTIGDDLNGVVAFIGDGTINIAADKKVVGTVTTATDNEGTIDFAITGNSTTLVSGNIGSSTLKLKKVEVQSGTGSGVTSTLAGDIYTTLLEIETDVAAAIVALSGDCYCTTVHMNGSSNAGTLNLADGSDISGAVTTQTDDKGTINIAGASTISGDIGSATGPKALLALNVNGSKALTLGGGLHVNLTTLTADSELYFAETDNVTAVTGAITTNSTTGKVNVGTATVTVSLASTINAAGTLKVTIGTTNGKLVATNGVTFHANTKFEPIMAGAVTSGTAITVYAGNSAPTLPTVMTDNYDRYSFALAVCNTNDLCLTPTLVTPTGVSSNSAAVSAIADIAFASDATLSTALNTLSGASLDKALVTLAPTVDGGAIVGAVSAGAASGATISTQMASLRSGIAAGQGLNAGDGTGTEERFWTQAFGTYAEQDIRQKIAGFTSATGGVALGLDQRFRDDLVLGLAYSLSHTNVNSSESENETQVQGHQVTLYGSHDLDRSFFQTDGVFVDGQLSYAYNDYEGERYIEVGAVSRRADSAYDGLQISTKFDLGTTIKLDDGSRFTPTAGFSYSHVSIDSYSETNAGDSSLKLQDQDYDMFNFNLKGKVARTLQVDGIDVTPEVHLGYSYEAIHDKIQTLSTFQGGGDAFTSTGFDPANNTYMGGIGVTWGGDSMPVDVTVTYDVTHKADFLSHSGLLKGVWRF